MVRQRPPSVLVLAILNMVFGTIGALGGVCGGLGLFFIAKAMPQFMAQATAGRPGTPPMPDFFTILDKHVPGFMTFLYISLGAAAAMVTLLVVCGIGLLKMHRWARWRCIVYATLTILNQLGGIYFQINSNMGPAMVEYQKELEEWQQQLTPNRPVVRNPALAMYDNPAVSTAAAAMGALLNMAYPVVLLV